jgi:hypothetical protein
MSSIRGILLFALGVFAIYKGWTIHTGQRAWFAYVLGFVAIGLGVWRLLRRENRPLV